MVHGLRYHFREAQVNMEHLENFLELRERSAEASVQSIRNRALEFVTRPDLVNSFDF